MVVEYNMTNGKLQWDSSTLKAHIYAASANPVCTYCENLSLPTPKKIKVTISGSAMDFCTCYSTYSKRYISNFDGVYVLNWNGNSTNCKWYWSGIAGSGSTKYYSEVTPRPPHYAYPNCDCRGTGVDITPTKNMSIQVDLNNDGSLSISIGTWSYWTWDGEANIKEGTCVTSDGGFSNGFTYESCTFAGDEYFEYCTGADDEAQIPGTVSCEEWSY